MLLLLISIILLCCQTSPAVTWQDGNNGEVSWSSNCDFPGNDIGNVANSPAEQCGSVCLQNPLCKFFTWTSWNSGTCFTKRDGNKDSPAFLQNAICGFVKVTSSGKLQLFGRRIFPIRQEPAISKLGHSVNEVKQMLRIIKTRHALIATYGMGVAAYNNGKPWNQCDSNALVARAAGQANSESGSIVISVAQGINQQTDGGLQSREISNAFSAAADANSIYPGTVWGLIFTNEFVTDGSNGPRVLQMIKDNKNRAHNVGLKVGTRVQTCGEIWGGNNQQILIQIAAESDFIMCNLYPGDGASNATSAVQGISNAYYSARDGFWRYNTNLEVIIGETGWASSGPTFNNAVNTVGNQKDFWNRMKDWAQNNKVKVHMFEAFDEPWKTGAEGEKHFGWWNRPNNNEAKYVEKATGSVYQ